MSENTKKPTLAEEFGFEDERMTIEEIMAEEAEEDMESLPLSKYAEMWARYMEEEHPARKSFLVLEGIWQETLQEVSAEARELMENLENEYMRTHKPPTGDFIATVQYKEKMRSYAEEIIMNDVVYKPR